MENAPHYVIVGTSGHIDHGKTSLVRALTGTDTDRWEEEKRRGITIDLGFASLDVAPGVRLGFVDVPGHERFVKNMLAGMGGIDLVLLVVAADESVMPQTREHFEICRLLGIRHGIVVLTKVDLVDEEILELVKLEVEEYLAGSFLETAPVVPVSSVTGTGLPELRRHLASRARAVRPRSSDGLLRLPVDRAFTMKGFGSVVTGTLASGRLEVDDVVEILPGGRQARVRNVEVHGRQVQAAFAGQRTAVNLGGVARSELARGKCIVVPGRFAATDRFDALIELLDSAKPLKHAAPVHVHLATSETVGRAYILGAAGRRTTIAPGTRGFVQLRLSKPLVCVSGDTFILRQFSPLTTIAGGTVLLPQAPRRKRKDDWKPELEALQAGDPADILSALCRNRRYGLAGASLTAMTGKRESEWLAAARASPEVRVFRAHPLWVCSVAKALEAEDRAVRALKRFHQANPLKAGAPIEAIRSSEFGDAPGFFADSVIRRLTAVGKLALDGDLIRTSGHRIRMQADERDARDRLVAAFDKAGLRVPRLKEFLPSLPIDAARARRVLAALLREEILVRVSAELVFHGDAIGSLRAQLAERRGQRINVGEFKTMAGVSRKYAIPLLEYFDRQKVTLRDGDARRVL